MLVAAAEEVLARHGGNRDAVELPQEIDVPVIAAQLAVRDGAQPDRLLPFHDPANAVVFDAAQRSGGQRALLELPAGGRQSRGTQQTADLIGAKRRLHHSGHRQPPKVRRTSGTLLGIFSAACTAGRAFIVSSQAHARGAVALFMISGNMRGTPATIE